MFRKAIFTTVALMAMGCGPARYTVLRETNAQSVIKPANMYVGWLQLDEAKLKDYGFDSPDDFKSVTAKMNSELQKQLLEALPDKKLLFARGANEQVPADIELLVLFQNVTAEDTSGGVNGHTSTKLKTVIKFVDGKTKNELDSTEVRASTRGMSGWASLSSDAAWEATAHNVSVYVSNKISGKN